MTHIKTITLSCVTLCLCLMFATVASAQEQQAKDEKQDKKLPTIIEKAEGLERHAGFLSYYWDSDHGKILVEVDNPMPVPKL